MGPSGATIGSRLGRLHSGENLLRFGVCVRLLE